MIDVIFPGAVKHIINFSLTLTMRIIILYILFCHGSCQFANAMSFDKKLNHKNIALEHDGPNEFIISWYRESSFEEASNLLMPVKSQQFNIVYSATASRLCVTQSGNDKIMHILWKKGSGRMIDVINGFEWPFMFDGTKNVLRQLPLGGITEDALPRQDPLMREFDIKEQRKGRVHVKTSFHGIVRAGSWLAPARITTLLTDFNSRSFSVTSLVQFNVTPQTVERALESCETRVESDRKNIDSTRLAFSAHFNQKAYPFVLGMENHDALKVTPEWNDLFSTRVLTLSLKAERGSYDFLYRGIANLRGARCPHFPTCSSYCALAVRKYGLLQGSLMTMDRLLSESSDLERSGRFRMVYIFGRWRIYDPIL